MALKGFPVLYYAYWFMLILLAGTLAFFIPHSLLTGIRELAGRKRKVKKVRKARKKRIKKKMIKKILHSKTLMYTVLAVRKVLENS